MSGKPNPPRGRRGPLRPPFIAALLLRLTLPPGPGRESLLGDLAEEYVTRAGNGRVRARAWYWKAAVEIAGTFFWDALRSRVRDLFRDGHFAARGFRRSPGFALFAAATLALGIGVTTSVFSVADALLLRPLQLRDPDRLVRVHSTELGEPENPVAGATYLDWREGAHSFEGLAGFRRISMNLLSGDYPRRIRALSVTSDFFEVLGVQAALGRTPAGGDAPGAERTAILSHSLWQTVFGADPGVIGQDLVLDGEAHTVVGILPADFRYPESIDAYVPSPYRVPLAPGETMDRSDDRGAQYLSVVGRLAVGVSVAAARAEMEGLSAQIARAYPETNAGESTAVVPLRDDLVRDARSTLMALLGAVAVVLLVACANVANLFTVRASRRSRELAVRMGLGAGPGHLRRQLLTESVLLSLGAGLAGFLLSVWGTRALVALAPDGIPRLGEVAVDLRVFAFSLLLALVAGLLFGLIPAIGLAARRDSLASELRGGRRGGGRQGARINDIVVVAEVALSLLLLVGAGLMVRTFLRLHATHPGFDASNTVVAHVSLPVAEYADDAAMAAFYEEALDRIGALPGVESAATVLTLPMHWAIRGTFGLFIEGRADDPSDPAQAGYQVVSPGYFGTLRIPLLRGRSIEDTDRPHTPIVAVVNRAMADRYWPGEDPIGRRFTFWGDPADADTEWATVVGVVGNTAIDGLDRPAVSEAFLPQSQLPHSRSTFVVRTVGDPYQAVPSVRAAIGAVDAELPLYGVSSLDDVVADSLAERRFRMLLMLVFAAAALVMAGIGLYGVLSSAVAQRRREIGIRKALGATRGTVVLQVARQGAARVLLGLALGIAGSIGVGRLIASQVYGVAVTDWITYVGSAAVMATMALLASGVPALRAAGVDPLETIREE